MLKTLCKLYTDSEKLPKCTNSFCPNNCKNVTFNNFCLLDNANIFYSRITFIIMKPLIYTLVAFLILALDRISVGSGSLLDSLLISAQKTGPPLHCVIAVSNENDPAFWTGSSVPVIHVNVNAVTVNDSIALLKEASKRCPMYIINVESIQDVKDATETYGSGLMQGSDGRYILLINKANFSQSKSFLQDNQSFFAKVIHVAVVIKRDSVGNLMLARDPLDESEVTLLDTFGGSKMHDNAPVFPTNRLTNLKGKQLTVTSFNYPPFNYVGSDGEPAGGEVFYPVPILIHLDPSIMCFSIPP